VNGYQHLERKKQGRTQSLYLPLKNLQNNPVEGMLKDRQINKEHQDGEEPAIPQPGIRKPEEDGVLVTHTEDRSGMAPTSGTLGFHFHFPMFMFVYVYDYFPCYEKICTSHKKHKNNNRL